MNTYKITNITNLAGKRDAKFNSEINIEYIDNITKKSVMVKPGETVFLTVHSLPLSVHRLRVKNLITVSEIGAVELQKILSESKPKPKPEKKVDEDDDDEKKLAAKATHIKKKVGKLEEEVETEISK